MPPSNKLISSVNPSAHHDDYFIWKNWHFLGLVRTENYVLIRGGWFTRHDQIVGNLYAIFTQL